MILVIDNYDSFTFNLVQYMAEVTADEREIRVYRNDKLSCAEIEVLNPTQIVISPGPCTPNEAGISIEVVKQFAGRIPILGVCLGHQAIAQAFGAKIIRAKEPRHGKTSRISHNRRGIFAGLEPTFEAGRYHSLVVEPTSLPDCIEVSARADDGEIMALSHRAYPTLIGLQFHPESVLTPLGRELLARFLRL